MAISDSFSGCEAEAPPLKDAHVDSAVDYKGHPASRRSSGRWRSAAFIICVEIAERFAFYGIAANLIMYLTGPMGQSTVDAAVNINVWNGTATVLPLLGAFVADSFLGRYRTIVAASVLYVLGLSLLTLSAFLPSPSLLQVALFFSSLYLVAVAQGGHKPCTQAFGADQFDGNDAAESKAKSSFFNWWYFAVCAGGLVTTLLVSYIQENFSWGLGFGIPCVAMFIALVVFLLGTRTYRYTTSQNERGPFVRIGRVFVAAFKNRRKKLPCVAANVESRHMLLPHHGSQQFKFLNKALSAPDDTEEGGWFCTATEVEEAKAVLRLLPIWGSCLVYGIVFAQPGTFFIKQGATMDRIIFSGFQIPSASFQCIFALAILVFLPVYDRLLVPTARSFTGVPSGITMLQRIGTGIFMSVLIMITAALVEIKRLRVAREHGLVNDPNATLPMSIWWLAPQDILLGLADVFTMVGMQEFFYDQVPTELRRIGLALYLSVVGVGSYLSSLLVFIIDRATGGDSRDSWFSDNLNRAHLDYFYWFLAALCALGFASYLHFARSYIYNTKAL